MFDRTAIIRVSLQVCDLQLNKPLHSLDSLSRKDLSQLVRDANQHLGNQPGHVTRSMGPTPIDVIGSMTAQVLLHEVCSNSNRDTY